MKYILSNPVYIGKLRRRKNPAEKKDRFYQGADVEIVDGEHEPIISEKMFYEVQKNLKIK